MLRLLFVFGIIATGAFYSMQGPFYALLFYLWNAYFRPEYWVWNDALWSLRLSLLIGSFLVVTSLSSLSRFKLTFRTGLILLFFLQTCLSLLASPHQEGAMPYWTEFMKVMIITLLITIHVDSLERLRLTFAVIAYSLGFEAAKQGWAQLVLNPGATNNNPHLMLGDNNGVALGMMMLIPIFMALSQTTHRRWERWIHQFFIAGVIYRGVSTYSRGGFLMASLVGLVSLWRSKQKIRMIVIVAVVVMTISAVMPQAFWDRMQTITATEEDRDASARGRLYYWGVAMEIARDHPILGVGVNSFRFSFAEYADGPERGSQRAVHSAWFGVLSELGYPGFILFVLILLTSIYTCFRIRRRATAAGLTDIATYAGHLQTSLLVFVIGGTFLHTQYLELLWHFVGLTVALEQIYLRAAAGPVLPAVEPARPNTNTPATVSVNAGWRGRRHSAARDQTGTAAPPRTGPFPQGR